MTQLPESLIPRPGERGLANGLQVAGYRVGMIVGGGILLILHDRLGAQGGSSVRWLVHE